MLTGLVSCSRFPTTTKLKPYWLIYTSVTLKVCIVYDWQIHLLKSNWNALSTLLFSTAQSLHLTPLLLPPPHTLGPMPSIGFYVLFTGRFSPFCGAWPVAVMHLEWWASGSWRGQVQKREGGGGVGLIGCGWKQKLWLLLLSWLALWAASSAWDRMVPPLRVTHPILELDLSGDGT